MLRSVYTWILFGVCLTAMLAAIAWISITVMRLDRVEAAAQQRAALEENVRLALWRLDAIIASRLAAPAEDLETFAPDQVERLSAAAAAGGPPAIAVDVNRTMAMIEQIDIDAFDDFRNAVEWNERRAMVAATNQCGVWLGDELVLVATDDDGGVTAGRRLEWPALRQVLLTRIGDLLPSAQLLPIAPGADVPVSRRTAGLQLELVPGPLPYRLIREFSTARLMLLVAWSCVLLPLLGVVILLFGIVSLNERRAAFVSAVTHELRTPLTTFRMYTEMLEGEMVPAEKRRLYLKTLRTEADRLNHLVENVLAYARLERGRKVGRIERLAVSDIVDRCSGQLAEHAERAGLQLQLDAGLDAWVEADLSAVERILFNLVDNACKYAVGGEPKLLHLETGEVAERVILRVRDHGPGIPGRAARRLFRPFSKSADDAAESAPGVGLGLALSRRLARQMGGDLRLAAAAEGSAFELLLVRAG